MVKGINGNMAWNKFQAAGSFGLKAAGKSRQLKAGSKKSDSGSTTSSSTVTSSAEAFFKSIREKAGTTDSSTDTQATFLSFFQNTGSSAKA